MSDRGAPIVFGPSDRSLFGVWHRANTSTDGHRKSAVVLVGPVGWEAIASHRALKLLTDRLTARGFRVLRFDHSGTGDSPGDEFDPGRVSCWKDGVRVAIDEAKRLGNVDSVYLIGIQLGATLACLAAEGRADVEGLVLWAPLITGQAFLRQVRAYRLLNDPGVQAEPSSTEDEDVAGFVLTAETIRELKKVDLLSLKQPLARRALVLTKDEHSPEEKLTTALANSGTATELRRISGYLPMMQEPRLSVVPLAAFECVEQWLVENVPVGAPAPSASIPYPRLELPSARESAFHMGSSRDLFGILTEPLRPSPHPRPLVLFLSTSYDHRVGPNRLYVTLARHLATLGFSSFRFDPRGVGDSAPASREEVHPYSETRIADTKEVMRFLSREHGAQTFALVGLCSAGYVVFHVARSDPRVVSEVLINPQTFAWEEGASLDLAVKQSFPSNRYYRKKLTDPETWRRLLTGEVNIGGVMATIGHRLARRARRHLTWLLPHEPSLGVEEIFRDQLERGTRVLLAFGEYDGGIDYIEGQLGVDCSALKGFPAFDMEVVPRADHTFSRRWMKELLSARIVRHLMGQHRTETLKALSRTALAVAGTR